MSIEPHNLIGTPPGLPLMPPGAASSRDMPGLSETDARVKQTHASPSFERILQAAVNTRQAVEKPPVHQPALPAGTDVLALAQRMKYELTEHLLDAFSVEQRPSDPEVIGGWTGLENLMCHPVPRVERSSTIRHAPSEPEVTGPSDLDPLIHQAAEAYDMDPALIRGVIQVESNFDPEARSPKGAMGLMQLMPETARELGVTDPYDPLLNIMGGTRYLKGLMKRYNGDISSALAAYNWGMGNLESHGDRMPDETRTYVRKVTEIYYGQNGDAAS